MYMDFDSKWRIFDICTKREKGNVIIVNIKEEERKMNNLYYENLLLLLKSVYIGGDY